MLHTTSIEIIGFAHNEIGDSGINAFIELIEKNPQFVHVLANGNLASKKRQKKLETLVIANAKAAAAKATAANGSDGVEDEDEDLEEALEMEISEKDEL